MQFIIYVIFSRFSIKSYRYQLEMLQTIKA